MRLWKLGLIVALPVIAQATPVLTPSPNAPPVCVQGTTTTITSNVPVTWALAAGSVGTQFSSTTLTFTYKAPATVVSPQLQGCSIPPDHVYNTRIDSLPISSSNTYYLSNFNGTNTTFIFDADFPDNSVNNNTPTQNMFAFYGNQNVPVPVPIPDIHSIQMESGYYSALQIADGTDHHLSIVSTNTCAVYDMYQYYTSFGNEFGCPQCNTQNISTYTILGPSLPPFGVDAAGMPTSPLLLRDDEVQSGLVRHALRASINNAHNSNTFIWPATSNAFEGGPIPYGNRFRLKANYDIAGKCSTAKYPSICTTILTTLKQYGVFMVDGTTGQVMDISGDGDLFKDPQTAWTISNDLAGIVVSTTTMEVVDESSLQDNDAFPSNPGLAALVSVSSAAYGTKLIATAISDSSTASIRIINQGTTVGFSAHDQYQWMQGGSTTTLLANVNGSTQTTSVTWAMSPSTGTLNSATGLYNAPNTTLVTTVTFTATSVSVPQSSSSLTMTLFPGGTLYVNMGTLSVGTVDAGGQIKNGNFVDSSSRTWITDPFTPGYYFNGGNDMWNQGLAGNYNNTLPTLGEYPFYSISIYRGDGILSGTLAPGNYVVQPIVEYNGASAPVSPIPWYWETNGQIVSHNFDLASAVNYLGFAPSILSFPATVQPDGKFYLAIRKTTSITPFFTGFVVKPDTGVAHIAIDAPQISSVTSGQTFSTYGVGWQMSGNTNWSITLGSGTLVTYPSSATYTAPVGEPQSIVPTTIHAVGASTPSITSNFSFNYAQGPIVVYPPTSTISIGLSQLFVSSINGVGYPYVTYSIMPSTVGSINATTGIYTAPSVLATTSTVYVISTSTEANVVGIATMTVLPSPPDIFQNVGDYINPFTDSCGNVWAPDSGHVDIDPINSPSSEGDAAPVVCSGAPCGQNTIYQSARYTDPNGSPKNNFYYPFALPNGIYQVTLKFCDYNIGQSSGNQITTVLANGTPILSNFDITDQAGGDGIAIDKVETFSITNHTLQLQFNWDPTTPASIALINAFQIHYVGPLTSSSGVSMSGQIKISGTGVIQ